MTTAKSLAGGLPLSAVTGEAGIMDSVHPGGLGGTYGGNPLSCRAALAVLEAMEEEDLVAKGKALGRKMRTRLEALAEEFPLIGQVRGLGPMLALELVKDPRTKEPAPEQTKALVQYCLHHGLIILDCGTLANNVRMLMPLTITGEQLDKAGAILRDGLVRVTA